MKRFWLLLTTVLAVSVLVLASLAVATAATDWRTFAQGWGKGSDGPSRPSGAAPLVALDSATGRNPDALAIRVRSNWHPYGTVLFYDVTCWNQDEPEDFVFEASDEVYEVPPIDIELTEVAGVPVSDFDYCHIAADAFHNVHGSISLRLQARYP